VSTADEFGYRDRSGEPIDYGQWMRLWAEPDYQRILLDEIDEVEVSTIWLGFTVDGRGHLFETMVFGGASDGWCQRYRTETGARAGHLAVVRLLRGGERPQ
jgi:hypothetical protein